MSFTRGGNQGAVCIKLEDEDKEEGDSLGEHDLKESAHRFCYRDEDMKLWETGDFSDAQLIVEDIVCPVHKSIVCMRSDFLREALECASAFRPVTIRGHPVEDVELVLEFLYSGSIKAIGKFALIGCVDLDVLGENFKASHLSEYAQQELWNKLKPTIQTVSAITRGNTYQRRDAVHAKLRELRFYEEFEGAVHRAYEDDDDDDDEFASASKAILADFVCAARDWFLADETFQDLQKTLPAFGSRVLATLADGPYSRIVKADARLWSNANSSAGASARRRGVR